MKMQKMLFWQLQDGGPRTATEVEDIKEEALQMVEGLETETNPEI
jgi:hypothetical protein